MGAGWFIARETSGPAPLPHKGKALLFAQFQLEEWADELGIAPLKDFFSGDPAVLAEFLQSEGVETDQFDLPTEEWFDAGDVLGSIRPLIARLRTQPEAIQNVERVLADLNAAHEILESAAAISERVHIATAMPDLPHE